METILICAVLFLVAIFLMYKKPLSTWQSISTSWDFVIGIFLIIFVVFYLTSVFVTQRFEADELAQQPCGPESPQGRCYNLRQDLCENLWAKATQSCQDEMADFLKAHPTSLIGPTANKCKARQMDKAIRFNRANTDSSYCKGYFKFIDEKQL